MIKESMNVVEMLRGIRQRGDRVVVVGLGVSGIETLRFLDRVGIRSVALEKSSADDFFSKNVRAGAVKELMSRGLEVQWGVDDGNFDGAGALAILSPGVSFESPVVQALLARAVPLISELELGLELFRAPYVVVSGSNGKSTTVSLLHHLLSCAGRRSFLCGNVGVPVVSELGADVLDQPPSHVDVLVVEASSYQLEGCQRLKPKAAVFLNLTENHLERHKTMERYAQAKARMFINQDTHDYAILNSDDQWVRSCADGIVSQLWWFGTSDLTTPGAQITYNPASQQDHIRVSFRDGASPELYPLAGSSLLGLHNRYNVAAAICAARALGAETKQIQDALLTFQPLTHRIEPLTSLAIPNVVLNDSKSTTVAASVEAVRTVVDSFPNSQVVLMLGGQAKAGSWEPLARLIESQRSAFRALVFFGKDGAMVHDALKREGLKSAIQTFREKTLREATGTALETAQGHDVVLLSPGCASFDEFTDFEQRGEKFKQYVGSIATGRA